MTCPDCSIAETDPGWPGLDSTCPQCEIRTFARSPDRLVESWLKDVQSKEGRPAALEKGRKGQGRAGEGGSNEGAGMTTVRYETTRQVDISSVVYPVTVVEAQFRWRWLARLACWSFCRSSDATWRRHAEIVEQQ